MNEQPLSNKVPLVKAKQIMFSYYQLGLDVCVCAGDVFIVLCVCVCVTEVDCGLFAVYFCMG